MKTNSALSCLIVGRERVGGAPSSETSPSMYPHKWEIKSGPRSTHNDIPMSAGIRTIIVFCCLQKHRHHWDVVAATLPCKFGVTCLPQCSTMAAATDSGCRWECYLDCEMKRSALVSWGLREKSSRVQNASQDFCALRATKKENLFSSVPMSEAESRKDIALS